MILDDLVRIYLDKEQYHKTKLSEKEARRYFQDVLKKNRVIWHTDKGSVVGYIEAFRVNKEQLERIIMNRFTPMEEDLNNGDICFIRGLWIDPEHRGKIGRHLKTKLFRENRICKYFCGYTNKGLVKKFKIFKKGGSDGQ